ncbi:uncharacterized protein B4U79_03152, partial [Dinothrombium tinctorium]
FTDDIYQEFKKISSFLDTSNYPVHHYLKSDLNKQVLGKLKDEMAGKIITEFVGLKSKMYAFKFYENEKTIEKKKAKGVTKSTIKTTLKFDDYKELIFQNTDRPFLYTHQHRISVKDHTIFSVSINKLSLSLFDDKRYILDDGINTLAFGHKDIL